MDTDRKKVGPTDIEEGGAIDGGVFAPAPDVSHNPEEDYYRQKHMMDGYLNWMRWVNPYFYGATMHYLRTTEDLSTREIAAYFRQKSVEIWRENAKAARHLLAEHGVESNGQRIPIQEACNDKLWTATEEDGTLNHIKSDDLTELFIPGAPQDWPNLVLTSNHARAWQSKDLTDVLKGIAQFASDAWGKNLPLLQLKHNQHPRNGAVRGKTIVALACHTEKDILLNGANLIDRRLNLEEDPNIEDPAKRSMEGISPAAVRLAKLILKLTVEPQEGKKLVDLDRPVVDAAGHFREDSFVAADHGNNLVLRADAASIAQHIKLVGYSKGANTVADALRYLYREYAALGPRLQQRGRDGVLRTATAEDMRAVMGNLGLLSIAPGEVPLTDAEKFRLGITRTTLLNTHDLTAGHLVQPDAAQYHQYSDRLIQFAGTTTEMGHSIADALGKDGVCGYIMNPANAEKPGYQAAQDEVKAFFASNFQKQALTTICFWQDPATHANKLYLQFAPGISRVVEAALEARLMEALHTHGFPQARIASDFSTRRRMEVVLDHDPVNIEHDAEKLARCRAFFEGLDPAQGLFISHAVSHYIAHEIEDIPRKQAQLTQPVPIAIAQGARSEGSKRVLGPAAEAAERAPTQRTRR